MGRSTALAHQVRSLREAADLSAGRVEAQVVADARRITDQVDRRLAFSGDQTVVALAGATGSGKSSMFNAITGTNLAKPGVRRPTTSVAMAAAWNDGPNPDVDALLDWLEINQRQVVSDGDDSLKGLVLLDLPDHDSTETEHRLEVDRLVALVDMFVWVVDPQKYADAALHDNYLKPLAAHAGVMIVALNQADRLPPEELARMMKDLRALLDSEGLKDAELVATSAVTGMGIPELRKKLAKAMSTKQVAARRLATDVAASAAALRAQTGDATPSISGRTVERLSSELALAAGSPVVESAVKNSWRRRGMLATGWPFIAWVATLRPDPLRRLHLDQLPGVGKKGELAPAREQRSSLPAMSGVSRARVGNAVRALGEEASAGLPRGWAEAVRDAARRDETLLPDELDRAIGRTDLGMDSGRGWWWIVRLLQWVLMVAVVVGLGWLALDWILWYFHLPQLPTVYLRRPWELPTVLAGGGAILGVVLSLVARVFVEWGARWKAAAAGRAIRESIAATTRAQVVAPVEEELDRHRRAREALSAIR